MSVFYRGNYIDSKGVLSVSLNVSVSAIKCDIVPDILNREGDTDTTVSECGEKYKL